MPARLFCVGPAEDRLRYALESPEHQGSEGCVYRATFRPSMGVVEEVAVKVLVSPHVYLDRKLLRRLRGLQHPHLVGIRDVFTGPAPPGLEAAARAFRYLEQLAEAVDYLHFRAVRRKKVLHRDIKPDNIVIDVKDSSSCLIWASPASLPAPIPTTALAPGPIWHQRRWRAKPSPSRPTVMRWVQSDTIY